MDKNKFCTAFDYLVEVDKKFQEAIIRCCLTTMAVKKSLIIPPASVTKKMLKMKDDDMEKLNLVRNYILRSNISPDKFKEFKDDNKLYIFRKEGFYYKVTVTEKSVSLNDVKLEVVKKLNNTTLYRVKKEIIPIQKVHEKKEEKVESKEEEIKVNEEIKTEAKGDDDMTTDEEFEDEGEMEGGAKKRTTTKQTPLEKILL